MLRPPSPAGSGPAPAKIRRVMTPRPSTPGGGGAAGCGRMLTRSGAVNPCSVLDPSNPIFLLLLARRGGCAKTTTALNLAFALANRGYNVLLVSEDIGAGQDLRAGLVVNTDRIG